MLSRNPRRRGNVVVAVAVSLVTLLACISLSVDGGMLQDKKRQVQAASDAAALAAAGDLYYNWPVERGADTNDTAYALAVAAAKANGYEDGVNGTSVVVNIPPLSGQFIGIAGYAEVIITFDHPRYFSRVIGTEDIPIPARATARGRNRVGTNAIICLDPNDKGSLNAGGGGTVNVTGAAIQVNSAHTEAVIANGGGIINATEVDVTGGYTTSGGNATINPTPITGMEPIPDPLAFLPPPDPGTMTIQSRNSWHKVHGTWTLSPGVYIGGISIGGDAQVTLLPGIYYMMEGGFSWTSEGSLTGNEVMIYNDPDQTSDVIDLSGKGSCNITTMTSGPYQGITIWQERGVDVPISVVGQGSMNITGTFYAAGSTLKVTGFGETNMIGSQYIADNLITSGNGTFNLTWTDGTTPDIREVMLVE